MCFLPFASAGPAPAPVPALAPGGPGIPTLSADAPWMPPAPPDPPAERDPDPGGRLLSRRAVAIVAAAIALGGLMQLAAYLLSRDDSITQDALTRIDIVMTLSFYAVVAVLIVSQITPNVRLRWGDGPLLPRLGVGAVIGLGLGGVLLALVSVTAGRLYPDPRIVQLMSAGDPTHIVIVLLLTCVIAPLVEETMFRGLLLEALRPRGIPLAVIVSAVFFAVWHFIPTALLYYVAMGAGLGMIYLKRGMASSMAAHACFNGVLTVAAIFVVLGPSHTFDVDGLELTAPGGWSQQTDQTADLEAAHTLLLQGPDGSRLFLTEVASNTPFDPDLTAQHMRTEPLTVPAQAMIDQSTVRQVELPTVGTAVEADVAVGSDHGTVALFAAGGQDYATIFVGEGSSKAEADFTKMLTTLRLG
jgi:membrane protease YdiL (CAAX protease family)